MSDELDELDELAAALGRRAEAREQSERAPEWEAVARGELSVEAALERRGDSDDTQDAERAAAYFRPFDPDETAALVDGLLAHTERDQPAPAPERPSATVLWFMPAGLLLAAAAAIVLWWVLPPGEDVRRLTEPSNEPIAARDQLPGYALETDGGLQQLRGEPPGPADARHDYQQTTAFQWVLRPAISSSGEVGVRGFVFVDGSSAGLPLDLRELAEVAESGAIQITGTIEQLGLEPGRYTIALVIGRPTALPEHAAELNVDQPQDGAWQVRRLDVQIAD